MTCTAQESSSPLIYRKKNENKEGKETLLKKKKNTKNSTVSSSFPNPFNDGFRNPSSGGRHNEASGTAKQILSYQSNRASRRASILSPPRRSLVGRPNLVDYLHRRASIFGRVSRGWVFGAVGCCSRPSMLG